MIPDIGLMVAAYIVTRMVRILASQSETRVAQVFAVVTILVAIVVSIDLIRGSSTLSAPPFGTKAPASNPAPFRAECNDGTHITNPTANACDGHGGLARIVR
jgi:hypothetical protein